MSFPSRVRWMKGRYANVDGIPFTMPVGTSTSPALFAGFSVDAGAARAMLPGQELHPVRLGSRALMVLAVVNYQDTTIGRYVEFCIGILAQKGRSPAPPVVPLLARRAYGTGVYIYDLPVSSEISVKGGRGIWGMAKRQANLDFVVGPDTVSSQYDLDGQLVMRVDVSNPGPARLPVKLTNVGYGDFRGMLTRSATYLDTHLGFTLRDPKARLLIGDHPRTAPLHALDVDPVPLFTGFAPTLQGVLDDHVETWFLTADQPPEPASFDLASFSHLGLSQEWLAPPDRAATDAILRGQTSARSA